MKCAKCGIEITEENESKWTCNLCKDCDKRR